MGYDIETIRIPKALCERLKLDAQTYGIKVSTVYGVALKTLLEMTEKDKDKAFELLTENNVEYTTKDFVKLSMTVDRKTQELVKAAYPMFTKVNIAARLFLWFVNMTDEEKKQLFIKAAAQP